jgi:hypothetical protein
VKKKTKGLSIKQERLVRGVTATPMKKAVDIVKEAGYNVKDDRSAQATYRKVLASPKVQKAIAEIFDDMYSDAGADSVRVLKQIINDPKEKPLTKIKAIETIAKFLGWNAPQKHQSLTAKVDYTLPGTGKKRG